jgi:hypothetical protein
VEGVKAILQNNKGPTGALLLKTSTLKRRTTILAALVILGAIALALGTRLYQELTVVNAAFCEQQTEVPQVECEALVALYHSARDVFRDLWRPTQPLCSWRGVWCQRGAVTRLYLNSEFLNVRHNSKPVIRRIPPELGNLTELQILDLSSNQLSSLPPELGNLASLQTLDLSHNRLSSLPPELGNLANLQTLNLSVNPLSSLPQSWATYPA